MIWTPNPPFFPERMWFLISTRGALVGLNGMPLSLKMILMKPLSSLAVALNSIGIASGDLECSMMLAAASSAQRVIRISCFSSRGVALKYSEILSLNSLKIEESAG